MFPRRIPTSHLIKSTRSATHRKTFQSHTLVFFSKKNYFSENNVFSKYDTFFPKTKKIIQNKKMILARIIPFFTKKKYKQKNDKNVQTPRHDLKKHNELVDYEKFLQTFHDQAPTAFPTASQPSQKSPLQVTRCVSPKSESSTSFTAPATSPTTASKRPPRTTPAPPNR